MLTSLLKRHGFHEFEGYSQQIPNQIKDLIELSRKPDIAVMEIGFNAGHSAEIFLNTNRALTLTSFDLGQHKYVSVAKGYIDAMYPNRHTLILGNSTETVPKYIHANPGKTFDLIFIDGGHDYKISNADLVNCKKLANEDTVVIMDDTVYADEWTQDWTLGPTKTWVEHVTRGEISEMHKIDYEKGRGMSWGKYVFYQ